MRLADLEAERQLEHHPWITDIGIYLFNYRVNLVGCDQVTSTFMHHLEAYTLYAQYIFLALYFFYTKNSNV
jgi:hypothetical protein